jgi:hypothetical protein
MPSNFYEYPSAPLRRPDFGELSRAAVLVPGSGFLARRNRLRVGIYQKAWYGWDVCESWDL